jgi:hypothetical protein
VGARRYLGHWHTGRLLAQYATRETLRKAAALAARGFESWLGSVMSCFSPVIHSERLVAVAGESRLQDGDAGGRIPRSLEDDIFG